MTAQGRRVVVVGSGAAGLAAALGARLAGAEVLVLEGADAIGGTTAMSGGVVWVPGNHLMPGTAAERDDDRDGAREYLRALAAGYVDEVCIDSFLDFAPEVMSRIDVSTPVEWELLGHWPDYRGELPGASPGGRCIWPRPLDVPVALAARVQRDPTAPVAPGASAPKGGAPASDAVVLRGPVRGGALVAGLLAGIEELGVEVRSQALVTGLLEDASSARRAVRGVVTAAGHVAGAVVLATGGFQFDPALVRAFLGAAPVRPMGTPGCRGDGLRLAIDAGAEIANMAEGWWMPAMEVPGEVLDGVALHRPLHGERAQPGSLLVDRRGRRFVNEAQNYGDVGRAMARYDTGVPLFPADPCWLVFDAGYRARYPVGPLEPGDPDPPWLVVAPDVAGLADAIGVPAKALDETVERFNASADKGEDPDFGRGAHPYDLWIGDPGTAHRTLAALRSAPLYALEVHLGCMGTKGGPRTDGQGRVRSRNGGIVDGLYAAGNAAASPFGTATAAGGATLGPALTFGFLAGAAAATDPRR